LSKDEVKDKMASITEEITPPLPRSVGMVTQEPVQHLHNSLLTIIGSGGVLP
jgi:hypothetical protein